MEPIQHSSCPIKTGHCPMQMATKDTFFLHNRNLQHCFTIRHQDHQRLTQLGRALWNGQVSGSMSKQQRTLPRAADRSVAAAESEDLMESLQRALKTRKASFWSTPRITLCPSAGLLPEGLAGGPSSPPAPGNIGCC